MSSFHKSRSGDTLWLQDALWLEHGPQAEEMAIFIFNQIKFLKKTLCVQAKNLKIIKTAKKIKNTKDKGIKV